MDNFNGHYEDLKKVMEKTLTPRLPPLSSPSASLTTEDTTESTSEELSLDLDRTDHPQLALSELRSLRYGERPLPTPRSPRTPRGIEHFPPSPRGFQSPRTPRMNSYPPSPRSRSRSPPKNPRGTRRTSFGPRGTTPRTSATRLDNGDPEYSEYERWPSRRSSPGAERASPRSARSPRKSVDKPYSEVVHPPPYLGAPLSARGKMSNRYLFGGGGPFAGK